MNLLILEDYVQIRDTIVEAVTIEKLFDKVFVAGTIAQAKEIIRTNEVGMFMIDLTLPDGSGYEFISYIRGQEAYKNTWVIIETGSEESDDKVIDAFNNNKCQRYLKKPFKMQTVVEMIKALQDKKIIDVGLERKLRIKRKSIDYFFSHDEIIYLETVDKTAYLYTKDEKHAIGRITLSNLEEQLPNDRFVRVHRSFIVNKDYIDFISRANSQNQIKIRHYDNLIPVGRTYKESCNTI